MIDNKSLEILKVQIDSQSVSHAYIFESMDVQTGLDAALEFASMYNGIEDKKEQRFTKNARDLSVIEAEGKTITIDKIRELIKFFQTRPFELRYKTAIILEADRLRVESSNAMLKLLEDMPSYGKIILVAKSSKRLLPTITSRCQLIRLMDDEVQTGNIDREFVYNLIDAFINGRFTKVQDERKKIEELKDHSMEFFSIAIEYLGMIRFKEYDNSIDNDIINRIKANYDRVNINYSALNDVIIESMQIQKNLYNNVNFLLSVETFALKLSNIGYK